MKRKKIETVEFKKCKFDLELEYYYDEDLEEEYVDTELGNENLRKIRNEYRRLNNLLLDYKIKQIRDMYDLSQKDFAILLGLGEVTITRYESKTVQDKAQDEIIRNAIDPQVFYQIALRNKEKYIKEYNEEKFNEVLEMIQTHFNTNLIETSYIKRNFSENLTGNKKISLNKVYAIIKEIVNKIEKVTKTKLAKFLWYIDCLSYKETGTGITGLSYCHLPYGAVPYMFDDILNSDFVEMEVLFNGDSTTCLIKKCYTEETLDEFEIAIVEKVITKFKDMNTTEIVDYMHNEKGYIETKKNEFISYLYANDINF